MRLALIDHLDSNSGNTASEAGGDPGVGVADDETEESRSRASACVSVEPRRCR
jgi:hypothetical protein